VNNHFKKKTNSTAELIKHLKTTFVPSAPFIIIEANEQYQILLRFVVNQRWIFDWWWLTSPPMFLKSFHRYPSAQPSLTKTVDDTFLNLITQAG